MPHEYIHHAQYYETDQMGCVHHSNYIRWMEEARIHMLEQMGCGYRAMEEAGVMIPVLGVSCQYKSMVRFDEDVSIRVRLKEYNGIRMIIGYEMRKAGTDELCTLGESSHCFLKKEGRPLSLKRAFPQWDALFSRLLTPQDSGSD